MIQISFHWFVILISSDVLREIRADIAENLAKTDLRGPQKATTPVEPEVRSPYLLYLRHQSPRHVIARVGYRLASTRHRYRSSSSTSSASKTVSRTTSRRIAR